MWADNEAEVDLLGFEFLVDGLFYALTQPQLLPLTCGLLGDWGSGKSSVLGLLRAELERERPDDDSPSRFLCVTFSPWQHEGYDDVKAALINDVLDVLAERAAGHPELSDKVSFLRRCARGFARWSRKAGRGALAVGPSALPWVLQAAQPDLDPTAAEAIKSMSTVAAGAASQRLAEPAPIDTHAPDTPVITTAAEFREQLVELIDALPGLDALVVLVDDMDRCLPDTVVDTFEAIRIFLGTHKTAYVIAANEDVVQAAVDARYRQLINDGVGLGARYLEKMLQIRLRIPALSGLEADTYMNLLLAQLHLQPHQFDLALAHVRERRAAGHLDAEFTLGVCFELFSGETPPPLVDDLTWAGAISPVLAGGLRGNPRELKRFLNSLMLRHGSARRRGVELRRQVLAKLMVLEEQHPPDFRQLYAWQCLAHGPVLELAEAEAQAGVHTATSTSAAASTDALGPPDADPATDVPHGNPTPREGVATGTDDVAGATGERVDAGPGGAGLGDEADDAVAAWVAKDHVSAWLALPPSLADVDLRPYFAYARDRLVPGTGAATLSADLQLLLTRLQGDAKAVRERAGRQVSSLSPAQRQRLIETLLDALARQPSGPAFRAALDLLEHSDDALEPVTGALMRLPTAAVPAKEVPNALARLRGRGEHADAVVERWANSDSPQLAAAVTALRGAGERGRQRGDRRR